jgi:hypothetical protein
MNGQMDDEIFEAFTQKFRGIDAYIPETRGYVAPQRRPPRLKLIRGASAFIVTAAAVLAFLVTLAGRIPVVSAPSSLTGGAIATDSSTLTTTSASPSHLDLAMEACGTSMPGQIRVTGKFEAPDVSNVYQRIPTLPRIVELDGTSGPIDVVLFGRGTFAYPVPNMVVDGSTNANQVTSMLCIFTNGHSSFYPDVDLSGFVSQ